MTNTFSVSYRVINMSNHHHHHHRAFPVLTKGAMSRKQPVTGANPEADLSVRQSMYSYLYLHIMQTVCLHCTVCV